MFREVFCVPNTWFGVFDESMPRVIWQVSLDGSYGASSRGERMLAYAGLFGYEDAWRALVPSWNRILLPTPHEYFRSSEVKDPSLRAELGKACRDAGLRAVGTVAHEALLDHTSEAARKRDLFADVVRQLMQAAPQDVNFALICDREQDLAKQVSSWIDRLMWKDKQTGLPEVDYDRIAGICYMNSRHSLQIQAADLVAGLFREHAERDAYDPDSPMDPVLSLLTEGRMAKRRMVRSEFFSD